MPSNVEVIEHIGWHLWRVNAAWKLRFEAVMQDKGHAWFGEARGNLLQFIGQNGTKQSAITKRSGLSKQAIQQLVDELVQDNVVLRLPDPQDQRAKIITYTPKGLQVLRDANAAKQEIEQDFAAILGVKDFAILQSALLKLAQHKFNP